MDDLTAAEMREMEVDLNAKQTRAVLRSAKFRRSYEDTECGKWPVLRILHDGEWWRVGFTDLCDDVAVGISIPEPRWFKSRHPPSGIARGWVIGARLRRYKHGRKSFCVINAMTDG